MRGVIVAGTDTGVGKTILSSLLMCAVPEAVYWKPIQSGTQEETDSAVVGRLSECGPGRILPEAYRFSQPLSPHLASRLDHTEIESARLALPETTEFLIVETAGGVLVPLGDNLLQIEVMQRCQLPVLLAARSTLGTINHTLLTLEALRGRDIPIIGVIVNGPANPENERAIEQFGNVCVLGRIPNMSHIDRATLLAMYDSEFEPLRRAFIMHHS
jgi:dethiobiotin synthetase